MSTDGGSSTRELADEIPIVRCEGCGGPIEPHHKRINTYNPYSKHGEYYHFNPVCAPHAAWMQLKDCTELSYWGNKACEFCGKHPTRYEQFREFMTGPWDVIVHTKCLEDAGVIGLCRKCGTRLEYDRPIVVEKHRGEEPWTWCFKCWPVVSGVRRRVHEEVQTCPK